MTLAKGATTRMPHRPAMVRVMDRHADSSDRDDGHIEWETRPRAGWEEFCAARERLFASLDGHATLYRLEHATDSPVLESPVLRPNP